MKKLLLSISCLLVNSLINAQVSSCFNSPVNYGTLQNPRSIVSADFTGDGNLDLATANYSGNSISIFVGSGNGIFSNSSINYTVGLNPYSLTAADFNTDGKMDIAIANYNSDNVSVLLGLGFGSFASVVNYTVGYDPIFITSSDFNGDGKADLAVANSLVNTISVLLGTSSGSFAAAIDYVVGTSPYSITSADFNGDGKQDLAVANSSTDDISILLGLGTGSFSTAVNYPVANFSPISITSADFNGDGVMDLAAGEAGNTFSVLLGLGTGSFATAIGFFGHLNSLVSKDFNGDGKIDLAGLYSNTNVSMVFGNGTGSFATATALTYTVGNSSPAGLVSADFNGDGKYDLATANYSGNNISVLLNAIPTISVTSNLSLLCSGQTASLTATGATTYTWSTNSTNTVIAVSPSMTTSYTVTGTIGNGCSNVSTITQSVSVCTNIHDNGMGLNVISIYPNPNNGSFIIQSPINLNFIISNELGQVVKTISSSEINNHQLKIDNLNMGIYFIQGTDGYNSINQKIIVAE